MMKKKGFSKRCFLSLFLLVILFCVGCVGLSDWEYSLPNDYAVLRINSENIVLGKKQTDSSAEILIERYVTAVCFNESYIGVERLPLDHVSQDERFDIQTYPYNSSDLEYYLVDTVNGKIYGPYTAEGYRTKCEELSVTAMGDWIKTTEGKPSGAKK